MKIAVFVFYQNHYNLMKKTVLYFLTSLALMAIFTTENHAQCNEWIITGGTATANLNTFANGIDSSGNVFTVTSIDSSIGTFNNIPISNSTLLDGSIFCISKVDSTGNSIWTKNLEMNANGLLHGLHSNGSDVYVTTSFWDSLVIDGQVIYSAEESILIVKFDNNGNVIWYKNYELAANNTQSYTKTWSAGITVDNNGNVLVTGYFTGKLTFGNTTLETKLGIFEREVFVLKLDKDGNEIWAIESTGSTSVSYIYNRGWAITVDQNNDVLVGGLYGDEITFGSITVTEPSNLFSPYIAKFDGSTGNIKWIRNGEFIAGSNVFSNFYGITVDNSNNIIVTGVSDGVLTIDNTTVNTSPSKPIVLIKFDTNGNIIFAKSFGTSTFLDSQWGTNIEVDQFNNLYFSGNAAAGASFDNFTVNTNSRVTFFTTLDSTGTVTDLKYINSGAGSYVNSYAATYDKFENVYISGTYNNINDTLFFNNTSYINNDEHNLGTYLVKACVEKMIVTSNKNVEIPTTFSSNIIPNPNNGSFRLEVNSVYTQEAKVTIMNEIGQPLRASNFDLNSGDNTLFFEMNELATGIYFVEIRTDQQVSTRRLIKF